MCVCVYPLPSTLTNIEKVTEHNCIKGEMVIACLQCRTETDVKIGYALCVCFFYPLKNIQTSGYRDCTQWAGLGCCVRQYSSAPLTVVIEKKLILQTVFPGDLISLLTNSAVRLTASTQTASTQLIGQSARYLPGTGMVPPRLNERPYLVAMSFFSLCRCRWMLHSLVRSPGGLC